jgi:hypothetical protein
MSRKLARVAGADQARREGIPAPTRTSADNIDKLYASLDKLANTTRDRQFQMFWANIQVLGASVYSRPPIPVVVPRFRDRKPIRA